MSGNNEKCPSWFPGARGDSYELICFVQQKVQNPEKFSLQSQIQKSLQSRRCRKIFWNVCLKNDRLIFCRLTNWLIDWSFKLFLPPLNTHSGNTVHADIVFVALSHPLPSPLIDRQQLQLACVLSTAASVPDTEPIIALSQNTHTHVYTHTLTEGAVCGL